MFELLKLKSSLKNVGYDTRWTGWKEFEVKTEGRYFATAFRGYDRSLIFARHPDRTDELANEIARRMGYRLS